jgi:hypothetical protein
MSCSHCTHPLYAGIRCGVCGRWADEKEEEMNRDDIIRMARKAGMEMDTSGIGWTTADDPNFLYPECVYTENLERFAALVAAAEREACAKVCDPEPSLPNEAYTVLNNKATMRRLAAAIRARKE